MDFDRNKLAAAILNIILRKEPGDKWAHTFMSREGNNDLKTNSLERADAFLAWVITGQPVNEKE